MKILLVAATEREINPLLQFLSANYSQANKFEFYNKQQSINVLITGVGMVATAFQMGRKLALSKFDVVINAGIAGAINRKLKLGEVVQVTQDQIYNFGAEDKSGDFISIFELGLIHKNDFPFQSGILKTNELLPDLKSVSGITVQKVHGAKQSIKLLNSKLNDVESMEGAAFLFTSLFEKIKCHQIRSISNFVEERNKDNWNIPLAINNLNKYLIKYFNSLLN